MSECSNIDAAQSDIFDWAPAELVRDLAGPTGSDAEGGRFALIVLNQPLHHLEVTRQLWNNAHVRIAADGGANALYQAAGQQGDSSFVEPPPKQHRTAALHGSGRCNKTQVIRDPDQESTDFGKAVTYVRRHYSQESSSRPLDIVAIGGLGGRVDQGLSQLHHLYLFQAEPGYARGRMYLFSGESMTFLLKPGTHRIRVRDSQASSEEDVFGKHVGILPIGRPSRITTRGLEWDVQNWETQFGGRVSTSNHVLPETQVVEVQTTEEVLFTIALRQQT
ncbi:thiamine pyrophosphokinase 1 [Corynascus novoguineensis]|uniref:Thiamine pyrophosphokinase n=1 Tax=Corynascus novoguineensis TaxID=1126955 RepID=A0AAN7CPY2_9PEZI|nr:thiamine pyrophosphokinase 1 [Corynascus novoguineensis]